MAGGRLGDGGGRSFSSARKVENGAGARDLGAPTWRRRQASPGTGSSRAPPTPTTTSHSSHLISQASRRLALFGRPLAACQWLYMLAAHGAGAPTLHLIFPSRGERLKSHRSAGRTDGWAAGSFAASAVTAAPGPDKINKSCAAPGTTIESARAGGRSISRRAGLSRALATYSLALCAAPRPSATPAHRGARTAAASCSSGAPQQSAG